MNLSQLMQKSHKPTRWDNMFFAEAVLWSRMSHDVQTQCGCVLVKNKSTISTGYNGFMRDIEDNIFPTTRPDKYPFMIHAEANAVYNAAREGKSTIGSRAYITAPPCISCLQMLWQCGVHEIYFTDVSSPKMGFYGENYTKVLEQVQKSKSANFEFKYFPKKFLSSMLLKQSVENFEKIDEDT